MVADAAEKRSDTEMAILDPAYLPARPDRGRGKVFFAGAALAIFFALGLAGARVLLNDTLYDEADVEALGGPPVLASMPEIPELEPPRGRAMVPLRVPAPEDDLGFGAEGAVRRPGAPSVNWGWSGSGQGGAALSLNRKPRRYRRQEVPWSHRGFSGSVSISRSGSS
jgi:hypothetical protein